MPYIYSQAPQAMVEEAIASFDIVVITLVVSIPNFGIKGDACGMDYITVSPEAEMLGWSERDAKLLVQPEETLPLGGDA